MSHCLGTLAQWRRKLWPHTENREGEAAEGKRGNHKKRHREGTGHKRDWEGAQWHTIPCDPSGSEAGSRKDPNPSLSMCLRQSRGLNGATNSDSNGIKRTKGVKACFNASATRARISGA